MNRIMKAMSGLRGRFFRAIAVVYVVTGSLALLVFAVFIQGTTRELGEDFAVQYALHGKNRILSPIQREVALTLKLVDTPAIRKWIRQEDDDEKKERAFRELESFRNHFRDRSYFLAIDASRHMYYSEMWSPGGQAVPLDLDEKNPDHGWYFSTMASVDRFALNVNISQEIQRTKVWINAIIRDGDRKAGMAGTGIPLDQFIRDILKDESEGVSTILFNGDGAVQAHSNARYIDLNSISKNQAQRSTIYRLLDSPQEAGRLRAAMAHLAANPDNVETLGLVVSGNPCLAAVSYLPEIDWYALTLLDRSRILGMVHFAPLAGLFALSLLLLLLVLAFVLNRIVLNPLAALARSSRQIASGSYANPLTVRGTDEIASLTRDFNHMAKTVKDYTTDLERIIGERTEALSRSHEELTRKNAQILDSIRCAERIQRSVLPSEKDLAPHLDGFFALWKPRDVVGGDFFYFHTDDDGCLLAVIDCTGHGVPGAFMTMTANSVLNHITGAICADDPAAILSSMNRILRETLNRNSTDQAFDNGMDMGICRWDRNRGELLFSGAGIDLFYTREAELIRVRGDRMSIGYQRSSPDHRFSNQRIALVPGTIFYLSTDGFADQAGGDRGFGMGRRRFLEALKAHAGLPLCDQRDALERHLADYQGAYPQRDDITVVGFRIMDEAGEHRRSQEVKQRYGHFRALPDPSTGENSLLLQRRGLPEHPGRHRRHPETADGAR